MADTCATRRAFSDNLVAWALGEKSHGGVTYQTTAQNVTGLLQAGTQGINHGEWCDPDKFTYRPY